MHAGPGGSGRAIREYHECTFQFAAFVPPVPRVSCHFCYQTPTKPVVVAVIIVSVFREDFCALVWSGYGSVLLTSAFDFCCLYYLLLTTPYCGRWTGTRVPRLTVLCRSS